MYNIFPIQLLLFHICHILTSHELISFNRNISSNLCNRSYELNICMLPMKSDLSQHLQQSIKYAQSHQHESFFDMVKKRVKRGFVGIASKLKRIGSKLGGLESLVGGTGGGGSQGGGGGNGGQSMLKEKIATNKDKIKEYFEEHAEKNTLADKFSDIEITNDVSFDGFDEFKMSDTKIEFSDGDDDEGTGTTESINFPDGVGLYIALECYRGINQDRCSSLYKNAKNEKQKSCGKSMIPSAFIIGTGFLVSTDGVDKTRRKSLINRLCNKPIKYGNKLIPDGMSIAEIYDSEAHSAFFSDVGEFVNYLSSSLGLSTTNEEQNSIAASIGGGLPMFATLNANTENIKDKSNYDTSQKDSDTENRRKKQMLFSLFEINIIRYSLYLENLRPEYMNPFFMIDFMSLPENYFLGDAVHKYEQFLLRYGTHYIHSAEFGGQILFENSRVDTRDSNVNDMAEDSWKEIQSAFGSSKGTGGDTSIPTSFISVDLGGNINKIKTKNKANSKRTNDYAKINQQSQRNWTNIFLQSQGGKINVAKLITRFESNTGPALSEWLRSIPRKPKAFKMKMRTINELLNFNVRVLFNYQQANETCKQSPTVRCMHGTSIEEFQKQFDERRKSLEFAIEIFRHKSSNEFTDLVIEAGSPETCLFAVNSKSTLFPSYQEILNGIDIKVVFQLDADYSPFYRGEEIYVIYHDDLWFSKKRHKNYNFLRAFKTPKTNRLKGKKLIVIKNLIFEYNEQTGDLIFLEIGKNLQSHASLTNRKESTKKKSFNDNWGPTSILRNTKLAEASYVNILQGIEKAAKGRFFIMPCNLDWSSANSRRFTATLTNGKCLKFIASSYGDIFVVFATNPHNEWSWYFVQITSYGVALYKAGRVVKYNLNSKAGSLKDTDLFRRFFICVNYEVRVKETPEKKFQKRHDNKVNDEDSFFFKNEKKIEQTGLYIQYGIIDGYDSSEFVHLNYFDENPLELRYYMFGSYDSKVSVFDINVHELSRDEEALLRCSQDSLTVFDKARCKHLCHNNCIGCYKANSTTSCKRCRFDSIHKNNRLECLDSCPKGFQKDLNHNNCKDINECSQDAPTALYTGYNKHLIYVWKKCSAIGSKCLNEEGSFKCECLPGYVGDGFNCTDVNECQWSKNKNKACPLNSKCLNLPGSFKCQCNSGFKSNHNKCIDVNECEMKIDMCERNSHCINTVGSYRCKCNPGFIGNGITCEDLNECDLGIFKCSQNSICVNTKGSYKCECKNGFKMENNNCIHRTDSMNSMIKEYLKAIRTAKQHARQKTKKTQCNKEDKKVEPILTYCKFKNNCDRNAICIYDSLRRTYSCKCRDGYIGNGFKCYDERFYFSKNEKVCRRLKNGQEICI